MESMGGAEVEAIAARRGFHREPRLEVPSADRRQNGALRSRLSLQRRAGANLRTHVQRALGRLAVLVAADLASFSAMRFLLRSVRDQGALGPWLADIVTTFVPHGL